MLQKPKMKMLSSLIALLVAMSVCVRAEDPKVIEDKLESQYALTQPTGDETDIVTAGAVIVLMPKRGNVIMAPVSSTNFYQNTYKDGKITQNALGKGLGALSRLNHLPGASAPSGPATRTFVPGEKMWVTSITAKPDGIIFNLFTDAYADVRYKAALKFQYPKGFTPTLDQVEKMVAEVFKVQPAEEQKADGQQQQAPPAGQAPPSAPLPAPRSVARQAAAPSAPPAAADPPAVIPPPPPPPTDAPAAPPKTTSLGQTTEQVVANLGPPDKIVKLGAKQIYIYKDFKVTFVSGKVTDVQ
jgi:hypothetical protein